MNIVDRLKQLMERDGLRPTAFAEHIGVSQATIAHIMSGRNKYPSIDVLMRLQQKYPDVSLDWLVNGEEKSGSIQQASSEATSTTVIRNVQNNPNNAPRDFSLPLFPDDNPESSKNEKDLALELADTKRQLVELQCQVIKKNEQRKITEIRIFFDDNTFEIFRPEK